MMNDYEANVMRYRETLYKGAIKYMEDVLAPSCFDIMYPRNQDTIRKILEEKLEHCKTRFVGWPIEKCVFQDPSLTERYMHRLTDYPYGKCNRELVLERLDLAVQKVIGMPNYKMLVEEYASDVGFQIFPTEYEVSKHLMEMILGCQKNEIYEEHIPRFLTMTWFGRSYDLDAPRSDEDESASCPNSTHCYRRIYQHIVSLKHGDKFNYRILESYCGPVRTLFDPKILHKDVVWERDHVAIILNLTKASSLSQDSEESENRRRSIIESYDAVIQAVREFID